MFFDVFRFELNFQRRQYLPYVLMGVFFLLAFLSTTTPNVQMVQGVGNININSPYTIILTLSSISTMALFAAVAFSSNVVLRDHELNVAELFLTTPIKKFDYLYARFLACFLITVAVYSAGLLGVLVGEFMPWLDQERIGPFNLHFYWYGSWAVALPNLLLSSAIGFCIATVTRSVMASYVGMIALLMLMFMINSFTERETVALTSILDPFGATAIEEVARYWTVFEKNSLVPPFADALFTNRMVWLLVAVFFLVIAAPLTPFTIHQKSKSRKQKLIEQTALAEESHLLAMPLVVNQTFNSNTHLQQYYSQARLEVKAIVRSVPFAVLLLMGLVMIVSIAFGDLDNLYGTPVYPTTNTMVSMINGSFSLSLIAVLIYFSGELMVRERRLHIVEMMDAMPFPNWVMLTAKLTALTVVIVTMLLCTIIAGVGVQLYLGYTDIDILQYLLGLLFFFQFPVYLAMVLSIFFYILTRSKYAAMALMIIYFILSIALPQMGFEHYLYSFRQLVPRYSDFTGYGHDLIPFLWQTAYWGFFGCLMLLVIHLLWPRGLEDDWKNRLRVMRQRINTPVKYAFSLFLMLFLASGGWIYYNTNILNDYVTARDTQRLQADYEKKYKQFQYLNQPSITDVYAEVDIFPDTRDVYIKGTYSIRNDSYEAIDEVHIGHFAYLEFAALEITGATQESFDEELGQRMYRFARPLMPGEESTISFSLAWRSPGFANNGHTARITSNGTFFNNIESFPLIGYRDDFELQDNNERRKYDLPPVQRMAKLDDESAWMRVGLGNSGRVNFEAVVSTAADQIAVAPGYLQQERREGERRYFHYKMDAPIWNFYSFMSGDYQIRRDSWKDVAIEVYYLHDYNVDTMIRSVKNSLDYFTGNFSPFQYRQFRILEFPQFQGTFAQSFPNTIPFSEAIGFTADLRDPKKIDYVYYVTAHELAHQWWAHQVLGADVQGSTMLVESLAQYSALMAMEKEYGADRMKRFLEFELDRYLQGRGGELIDEMPLSLVENQPYIHYRKGSVVLYALKDYIGEENMNRALANFLADFAFKPAPYPGSTQLIASIREQAAPEFQATITDMLERIILFDLRVVNSTVESLPDGRFAVSMDVRAHKFEANGTGEEAEIPISAWIDIGVFGAEQGEDKVPEVIHLEKFQITKSENTFRLVVDKSPVSVGIDPFNKLIDRNPADNIMPVSVRFAAIKTKGGR